MELMDIYSKHGTKVVYLDMNGYDHEKEACRTLGLIKNKEYTINYTEVHSSSTSVYLVEFPDKSFNSVMFGKPALKFSVEAIEAEIDKLKAKIQELEKSKIHPLVGKCFSKVSKDKTVYVKVIEVFPSEKFIKYDGYIIFKSSILNTHDGILGVDALTIQYKEIQPSMYNSIDIHLSKILQEVSSEYLE